ncbi:hypothetical protein MPTA5024_19660 [Microbispora sp. ATCC PTA-5024]|nr:hypothetical protein MPTA5024_19660 [Microbispora sp. ATCC PTA-5024]
MKDAGFGDIVAVGIDIGRLGRTDQRIDDARGVPPRQAGRRQSAFVIEGTPQHLEQICPIGAGQPWDVAQIELRDGQQGIRLAVPGVACFQCVQ